MSRVIGVLSPNWKAHKHHYADPDQGRKPIEGVAHPAAGVESTFTHEFKQPGKFTFLEVRGNA